MHYTFITPPASRAADRPTQIDDALVAEARRVLSGAFGLVPFPASLNGRTSKVLFASPMAAMCAGAHNRGVPIEKIIIAIKLAWASLPAARLCLGESGPEVLAGAVSACIEAYFATEPPMRAD